MGASLYLVTDCSSLTFVALRVKSAITKHFHCICLLPPANSVSACLYCHHFMKGVYCKCGTWLNVLENSQGEEPFISQAWAITEACSRRHNHLLELLENGSTKWYGLGVHHFVQGNFLKCHSNKSLFSVLAKASWEKRFPWHVYWAKYL